MNKLALNQYIQQATSRIANIQDEMSKPGLQPDLSQQSKGNGSSFLDHLRDSVKEVDTMQKTADKMAVEIASGRSENLHETMLASTHAELSFNLMVQVRNKALEAYQEVMRMPV